jgi:hypothetical protein
VRVVAPTPGTLSGTIASSTFSTHTTLVVVWDSGSLSNEAITSVSIGVGSGDTGVVPVFTNCQLAAASASIMRLSRYGGMYLTIDNARQVIPAAGVDLVAAGLGAATVYYIYAYMNAGVMTLEASATGRAADARNGLMVKSGDATRTLVGMARSPTSTTWHFGDTVLGTLSFYNRRSLAVSGLAFSGITTSSATPVALTSNGVYALTWSGEAVHGWATANATNNTQYGNCQFTLQVDGSAPLAVSQLWAPVANTGGALVQQADFASVSEGSLHSFIPAIAGNNTATFSGNCGVMVRG